MNNSEAGAEKAPIPRITSHHVDACIVSSTYTTLPSGKTVICELTLVNGFTVIGEAYVVNHADFKESIGRKVSYENARKKVYEMEAYLLHQRLHEEAGGTDRAYHHCG